MVRSVTEVAGPRNISHGVGRARWSLDLYWRRVFEAVFYGTVYGLVIIMPATALYLSNNQIKMKTSDESCVIQRGEYLTLLGLEGPFYGLSLPLHFSQTSRKTPHSERHDVERALSTHVKFVSHARHPGRSILDRTPKGRKGVITARPSRYLTSNQ